MCVCVCVYVFVCVCVCEFKDVKKKDPEDGFIYN